MVQKDADRMANSVDPDQIAPLGAVGSGSTLFAQPGLSENRIITVYGNIEMSHFMRKGTLGWCGL